METRGRLHDPSRPDSGQDLVFSGSRAFFDEPALEDLRPRGAQPQLSQDRECLTSCLSTLSNGAEGPNRKSTNLGFVEPECPVQIGHLSELRRGPVCVRLSAVDVDVE